MVCVYSSSAYFFCSQNWILYNSRPDQKGWGENCPDRAVLGERSKKAFTSTLDGLAHTNKNNNKEKKTMREWRMPSRCNLCSFNLSCWLVYNTLRFRGLHRENSYAFLADGLINSLSSRGFSSRLQRINAGFVGTIRGDLYFKFNLVTLTSSLLIFDHFFLLVALEKEKEKENTQMKSRLLIANKCELNHVEGQLLERNAKNLDFLIWLYVHVVSDINRERGQHWKTFYINAKILLKARDKPELKVSFCFRTALEVRT